MNASTRKFSWEGIRSVHLEVTERCNAACPMCPRLGDDGRPNSRLEGAELTLEDVKRIFDDELLRQLDRIFMCGSFGDPIVARDSLAMFRYFRERKPELQLGLNTNGSARSPEWWAELGRLLSGPEDYCRFGIDGLESTNALYRRNTRWAKIMESARHFIEAGGQAYWEFLVFQHNEHQVAEAEELARRMGFKRFLVKRTSRFLNPRSGKVEPFAVRSQEGEILYHLEPPSDEHLRNPVTASLERADCKGPAGPKQELAEFGMMLKSYFQHTPVDCFALKDRSVYVSAEGIVFPCCFLGGQYKYAERGPDGDHLEALLKAQPEGVRSCTATFRPLREVVEGPWFDAVAASWKLPDGSPEKVRTCLRQCRSEHNPFIGEFV